MNLEIPGLSCDSNNITEGLQDFGDLSSRCSAPGAQMTNDEYSISPIGLKFGIDSGRYLAQFRFSASSNNDAHRVLGRCFFCL